MNEKELKELQEAIKAEQKKQSEAVEELKKASESQKTEIFGKYDESEKKLKALADQFDAIQVDMKNNPAFGAKEKDSFVEMKKMWDDKSKIAALKEKGGKANFEIKAIMDTATNLSGSALATSVVIPMREPGIGKAPDRPITLLDKISRGNISSDTLTWIERSARTANAAAVAEGGKYAQSDMTYIQKTAAVERIGHYIKVQNRSLEDWDLLMSEINLELFTGLELILEEYVYKGSGSTPQLKGLVDPAGLHGATFVPAYTNATLTAVVSPNQYDCIRACIMQLKKANYQPNAVFINPSDGAAMDMPKTVDGIYLLPNYASLGLQKSVVGVPIYESNLVDAGSVLVGDFTRDALFMRRGIEIRIFEQNEDDALYDRKTITASLRCVNRCKTPDLNAFVYDTFADITAAIQ